MLSIVSIKDDGIGLKPEMLPHLFEIFSQAAPLYERSQEGLGIGLWLVKSLVEMHGGTITVVSDGVGKGSEFIVRLPVLMHHALPDTVTPNQQNESAHGRNYRVLVVDDRKNAADILAKLLRKWGHEVYTAYDGQEALLAAESLRPEVVLLDIGMPKMNGYEVCRQIRTQPWGQAMYLIAVSGWGQDQDRRQSVEAGFNHLVKPVRSAVLMEISASIKNQTYDGATTAPVEI